MAAFSIWVERVVAACEIAEMLLWTRASGRPVAGIASRAAATVSLKASRVDIPVSKASVSWARRFSSSARGAEIAAWSSSRACWIESRVVSIPPNTVSRASAILAEAASACATSSSRASLAVVATACICALTVASRSRIAAICSRKPSAPFVVGCSKVASAEVKVSLLDTETPTRRSRVESSRGVKASSLVVVLSRNFAIRAKTSSIGS